MFFVGENEFPPKNEFSHIVDNRQCICLGENLIVYHVTLKISDRSRMD